VNDLLAEALQQRQVQEDIDQLAQLAELEIDQTVSTETAVQFRQIFQRVEKRRAARSTGSTTA